MLSLLGVGIVAICTLSSLGCSARSEDPATERARAATELILKIRILGKVKQSLELENRVARENSPYLVVDFSSKRIELKARGRTLRVHSLEKYEFILTPPPDNERWDSTVKKPLRELQRSRIAAGSGENGGGTTVDTSWGPAKMPSEFDLLCRGGRVVEIRAAPASSFRIIRIVQGIRARLTDLHRQLSGSSSPAKAGRIRLWLEDEDSRVLFWSLPEKFPVIFRAASGLESDSLQEKSGGWH